MIRASEISTIFYSRPRLDQRHLDWFRRQQVSVAGLTVPDPVLRADIECQAGYFDIVGHDEEGLPAFIFLARDACADPVDIIAWMPRNNHIAPMLGAVSMLGEDGIHGPRLVAEGALPVWRSPIGWLRAERRGVVIIDPRRAADRLADMGPLLAEDVEHGRELRQILTRPVPRIVVPAARAAA